MLPFSEDNALWYMGLSKHFRRVLFGYAADDDTFNRENLEILGKA